MFKLFSFNSFYYHVVNGSRGPDKTGVPVCILRVVLHYADESGETYRVDEFYLFNPYNLPNSLQPNNNYQLNCYGICRTDTLVVVQCV